MRLGKAALEIFVEVLKDERERVCRGDRIQTQTLRS